MLRPEDNLEIEVKFYIEDRDALTQRLLSMGGRELGYHFETNIRYDDPENRLTTGGKLLRLRRGGDTCRLTFKRRPSRSNADFKIFHELEVEVGDFETMDAVLRQLGFQKVQTYEKWRRTIALEKALFCVDTMPYGDFLEIEGPGEAIRQAADRLGLAWEKRILTNYLSIFEVLRKKEQLPFNDITFSHFRQHPAHIKPYVTLFETGGEATDKK